LIRISPADIFDLCETKDPMPDHHDLASGYRLMACGHAYYLSEAKFPAEECLICQDHKCDNTDPLSAYYLYANSTTSTTKWVHTAHLHAITHLLKPGQCVAVDPEGVNLLIYQGGNAFIQLANRGPSYQLVPEWNLEWLERCGYSYYLNHPYKAAFVFRDVNGREVSLCRSGQHLVIGKTSYIDSIESIIEGEYVQINTTKAQIRLTGNNGVCQFSYPFESVDQASILLQATRSNQLRFTTRLMSGEILVFRQEKAYIIDNKGIEWNITI